MVNIPAKVFSVLRELFFDGNGIPRKFHLREKRNTQDDPFDEMIAYELKSTLNPIGLMCEKAPGPLISPDIAIYNSKINLESDQAISNPEQLIGIEVKKLERSTNGAIARASGLDYNSTPPCGSIRLYSPSGKAITAKGYYLFACLERTDDLYSVTAMCLCDGSVLNDDYDLYNEITGSREKGINLGTYGDGANRNRPMLIFANPLGAGFLDRNISLISGIDLSNIGGNISLAWRIHRKDTMRNDHLFFAYLDKRDVPFGHGVIDVYDPFPVPQHRSVETQGRGRFRLGNT